MIRHNRLKSDAMNCFKNILPFLSFSIFLVFWSLTRVVVVQAIQMGLVYGRELDGSIMPELSTCGVVNKLPYAFELSSVLFFLAPWTLIVVLYVLIGLKLYKSKRGSSRTTCSAHCRHTACLSSTNTRATGRVVKMLGEYFKYYHRKGVAGGGAKTR